jgi:hypothetical protein
MKMYVSGRIIYIKVIVGANLGKKRQALSFRKKEANTMERNKVEGRVQH